MHKLTHATLLVISLLISSVSYAVQIEAEGRAPILNNDIDSARQAAIKDASQQAAMQAAVFVSSTQVVKDGILEIDNMQIRTLGRLNNIEVVKEQISGNIFYVRIRANTTTDQGCDNGVSNPYRHTLAITAFPVQNLKQMNLGGLTDIQSGFPLQLANLLRQKGDQHTVNLTQFNLHPQTGSYALQVIDPVTLDSMINSSDQGNVNFILSGVIKDLGMVDPTLHSEDNYFIDLYNRLDYKSKKHLRHFVTEVYLHDAKSGQLILQKQFQTAGMWNLDETVKTGFASAAFAQQDYGKKIAQLRSSIAKKLIDQLQCEPFKTEITRTEGKNIWLDAGNRAGLKPGDQLTVYRRSTHFTPDMKPRVQFNNTQQAVTISSTEPFFSEAQLNLDAQQLNIRPGDLVIAR